MNYLLLGVCIILILECICESFSLTMTDVCKQTNTERRSSHYIFYSSIPKGGLSIEKYAKYKNMNEHECVLACCVNKMCNVAWHINTTCITFECDAANFDPCMPVAAQINQFHTATLFLLRGTLTQNPTQGPVIAATTDTVLTTLSTTKVNVLQVDISNNQTLTLPVNYVTLRANVHDGKDSVYEYQWSLLSKPSDKNSGKMDTTKTKELKLTDLIVGDYQFQVEVHGNNSYGKANSFVFVMPAKKQNAAPVAKILPNNQTIQLPNNVILDGSKSTDDDKIVSYYWELTKGPLEAEKKIKNGQSMLILDNLSAGNYTFKLTVKDVMGMSSSDTAYLTVQAEKDYPPQSDPGNNIIVELPVKFVILNGSLSRDDKKIVSYQWTKKSDALTADIQGVREPILNLTNLQEGTYTFNLKVTDSSGQFSDKDVQVFVKPRTNSRPVARASFSDDKSVTVHLPAKEAVLNGSLSRDDENIIQYQWQQIGGIPKLNLVDSDKPIAFVYDLKIGSFKFNLTVYDKERLASSDVVTLRIIESKNQKPMAKIVPTPDLYHLETNLIKIDGSISWDDVKISRYKWKREDDSLAVGQVLEDSDSSSTLMLTDLLPGLYKFALHVFDDEGLFDIISTSIKVLPSKYELYLVELQFICQLNLFTESKKNAFLNNIQLIVQKKLNKDTSKVVVHLVQLDKVPFRDSVTIVFYVTLNKASQSTSTKVLDKALTKTTRSTELLTTIGGNPEKAEHENVIEEVYVEALLLVEALSMLRYNSVSMEYQIVRVETYVCQNNCSFHGHCNQITKLCECETFWTGSFFRDRFGDGRPNCDWSIVYLTILFAIFILLLFVTCWFFLWIRQRRIKHKKSAKIRKHKYMKLCDYDQEHRMNSKSHSNGIKSRLNSEKMAETLLDSDSTLSSEEETTFINGSQRGDLSPIKKSSSFSSIPVTHGNPQKTL